MSDLIIQSHHKDLGGFSVYRSLPTAKKRTIGPFVFVDHMGPLQLNPQHMLDVRPHPHIGLMTVTYLFEGRGFHRDSIGSKQIISPGEINLMVAGKGISHSERTPPEDKLNFAGKSLHGLQIWIALPTTHEECESEFHNYPQQVIPKLQIDSNIAAEVLIGAWEGKTSPVKTFWKTLFIVANCKAGSNKKLSFNEKEIGILIVSGSASINGQQLNSNDLIYLENPQSINLECSEDTKIAIIGGDPHTEPRFIWWNFVSSRKERIREAAEQWKNQQFGKIADETDFIPLPNDPLP